MLFKIFNGNEFNLCVSEHFSWMDVMCVCVCVCVYTCIELRTLELICISGRIYIATKILAYNRRLYDSSFSQIL